MWNSALSPKKNVKNDVVRVGEPETVLEAEFLIFKKEAR